MKTIFTVILETTVMKMFGTLHGDPTCLQRSKFGRLVEILLVSKLLIPYQMMKLTVAGP